jgi:hypothetical protein
MTGHPASLLSRERFTELCDLACEEADQDKLGSFFEEILQLLESQTSRNVETEAQQLLHQPLQDGTTSCD